MCKLKAAIFWDVTVVWLIRHFEEHTDCIFRGQEQMKQSVSCFDLVDGGTVVL